MTQQTLNPEKPTEQFMRFISVYENDTDMLEAISQIFLDGKPFDLDPTFSKGNFYKKFPEPKFKSDLVPQREDVKECDCRDLNYIQSGTIKSICFDPPFLFRPRKAINNDVICARFSYFKTFEELIRMYLDSLKEFYRVLEIRGILVFKCQDMTDGKFYDTHTEIIKMARNIGFSLKDIGLLVVKNKIIPKAKKQNCLRKVHSYYLVFRKETAPVVTLNPSDLTFPTEKAINRNLKENPTDFPKSVTPTSLNSDIHQHFPFALQSRVQHPHFYSQQQLKSLERAQLRFECCVSPTPSIENNIVADNSFEVLPLTLQSEIKQHQIISLIKGNF